MKTSQPTNGAKGAHGVWRATVELAPRAHQYRFLVDGKWYDDPHRAARVPNPFGSHETDRQVACGARSCSFLLRIRDLRTSRKVEHWARTREKTAAAIATSAGSRAPRLTRSQAEFGRATRVASILALRTEAVDA